MRSIKAILFSAAFGFILSFAFGLLSHSFFLIILVKALVFALVFAGASFLISILYSNFLSEDSSTDMNMESSSEPSVNQNVGSKVDLVISDEALPSDDDENRYSVNDTSRQMLNSSDLAGASQRQSAMSYTAAAEPVSETPPAAKKITPAESISEESSGNMGMQAMPEVSSSNDKKSSTQPAAGSNAAAAQSSGDDESLDTLPDMNSFVVDNNDENSESDVPEVDSSDDFSTTVVHSSSNKADAADIQDAAIMAKAISSILSSEDR